MNSPSSSSNGSSSSGGRSSERSSNTSNSGSSSGSGGSSDDSYSEKRLFITLKPNARQTCYIFTRPLRVRVKGGGITPPLPSDLSGPNQYVDYVASSTSPESVDTSMESSQPTKMAEDLDGRMDDEHKLISRYAARLAANSRQKPAAKVTKSPSQSSIDANREQRELMQTLQNKNRLLLKEIRRLRDEHEETSRSAAQIAQNPQLLAELKLLRQRKDELELRMSALQESRRELMVQLEGLMNLLKAENI